MRRDEKAQSLADFEGQWTRFGGLSALKQEHFNSKAFAEGRSTFHAPPRRSGLFAFPRGYEEPFLIGSTCDVGHISNKSFRLRNPANKKQVLLWDEHITENDFGRAVAASAELRQILKQKNIALKQLTSDDDGNIIVLRKPRQFTYKGELWHHLKEQVQPKDIIEEKGSWVLTSFSSWQKAFKAVQHEDRQDLHATKKIGSEDALWKEFRAKRALATDPYSQTSPLTMSRDHLEVFIERVK